jgi:hypothetical protein
MRQKFIIARFVLFFLLLLSPALAWNRAGHMVTGIIAYKELKANQPPALARTVRAQRLSASKETSRDRREVAVGGDRTCSTPVGIKGNFTAGCFRPLVATHCN